MVNLRGFFPLLVLSSVIMLSYGQDYCNICSDHTMCVYNNTQPACTVTGSGLNFFQILEILIVHNNLRQRVAGGNELRGNPGPQPPAVSMPDLSWDSELATIAQRWANQCAASSDQCRDVRRFKVGQNVGSLQARGEFPWNILTQLITIWYDEVVNFDSNQVGNVVNFNGVQHYTQMLWSTTTAIGCGYVSYLEGNLNRIVLVCNYGPAGNVNGGALYVIRT